MQYRLALRRQILNAALVGGRAGIEEPLEFIGHIAARALQNQSKQNDDGPGIATG